MRRVTERILKPGQYCKSGHVSVVLRRGSNGKPVHQIITATFLGPTPKGKEILHINGNPKDNRVINLRFGTRTENILDVYFQNKKWRKVGINEVLDIRKKLENGEKGSAIAHSLNLSQSLISDIKRRKTFWWLG